MPTWGKLSMIFTLSLVALQEEVKRWSDSQRGSVRTISKEHSSGGAHFTKQALAPGTTEESTRHKLCLTLLDLDQGHPREVWGVLYVQEQPGVAGGHSTRQEAAHSEELVG